MSITVDIKLKRADKVYREGENIAGIIVICSNSDFKHEGITLCIEGSVNLQISSKNVGILEAFYNSIKPIQLLNTTRETVPAGKISSGVTQIPFEITLRPKQNQYLYETYHGVYVNISYVLKCDIKRSFLSKDLQKQQLFLVQYWPHKNPSPKLPLQDNKSIPFEINPTSLNCGSNAPDFLLKGQFDSIVCNISKPLTGHLTLTKCDKSISSVELQLIRVETCGCAEGYAKEATEIQNIQIADGDIPNNIQIPIYMVFPRLFTCPTLISTNFKIEFEINIVILFQDDHVIANNFPITIFRE